MSNPLPLSEAIQKPDNSYRFQTTTNRTLPKGVFKNGNHLWVRFQIDHTPFLFRSPSDNAREAEAFLKQKKREVKTGGLVLENRPNVIESPKKSIVTFADFAWKALEFKSTSKDGNWTMDEAKMFLGEGKDYSDWRGNLKRQFKKERKAGIKPRFKFRGVASFFENLRHILKHFGNMDMDSIEPETIGEYIRFRKTLKTGKGSQTINNATTCISGIYRWGLKAKEFRNRGWINPYDADLHKQAIDDKEKRYVAWTERSKFLHSIDSAAIGFPKELFKAIVEIQPLWSVRIEDTFQMTCKMIDLSEGEYGYITFQGWENKGKRYMRQPIVYQRAKEILEKYMAGKGPDDLIFPFPVIKARKGEDDGILYNHFNRAFHTVLEASQVKPFLPHDWKRTFGMELGIRDALGRETKSHKEISLLMSHTDWKTTSGYYYDVEKVRDEAIKRGKLSAKVQADLRNGYTPNV